MILKIVQVGEPVLRQVGRELSPEEIHSARIQELIVHMHNTLRDAPGVGLAAPQIGESVQLAVIEDLPEYSRNITPEQVAERERTPVPFHVVINPKLTPIGEADVEFFEGCLSLNGFTALVPRYRRVRVECLDEHARPKVIEASGWYARILQHEIDHLNGRIYIDRMYSRTFMSIDNATRHWKDTNTVEVKKRLATYWRQRYSNLREKAVFMLRKAVAILLMSTSLWAAENGWKERLNLDRLLENPEALNSLKIAYTSFDNKLSLYVYGNGRIVTQPTTATTELVPTCTADISDEQVRALVQMFVDKRFFDLPRKDFMMLNVSPDEAWALLHLHTIRVSDDEGTSSRTFGTGEYNGEKQELPQNFAALRDALIQLRDSAFPKRDPGKPCRFETRIKK